MIDYLDYPHLMTAEAVADTLLTPTQQQVFTEVQAAVRADYTGWHQDRSYPYIALTHGSFVRIVAPHLKPKMHVVDVGCGAGDKLLCFKKLEPTLKITGIEHHPTMVAFARYMAPFATVKEVDALLEDYSAYDLVYMYCPLQDGLLQAELQHRCMETMKSGAVLVVKLQSFVKRDEDWQWPILEMGWVKP